MKPDLERLAQIDAAYKLKNGVLKKDGIVDPEKFASASTRILWITKEANWDNSEDVDLKRFFADVTVYRKWKRTCKLIVLVSWGILNNCRTLRDLPSPEQALPILQNLAIVNVNKVGGTSRSWQPAINAAYDRDSALLLEQVEAIHPDVVINASRVDRFFRDLVGSEGKYSRVAGSSFECGRNQKLVAVNAHHPNQTKISHEQYVNSVLAYFNQKAG